MANLLVVNKYLLSELVTSQIELDKWKKKYKEQQIKKNIMKIYAQELENKICGSENIDDSLFEAKKLILELKGIEELKTKIKSRPIDDKFLEAKQLILELEQLIIKKKKEIKLILIENI